MTNEYFLKVINILVHCISDFAFSHPTSRSCSTYFIQVNTEIIQDKYLKNDHILDSLGRKQKNPYSFD